MLQCQSCASYNESDVAFCGQCGAPLLGKHKRKRGPTDRRRQLGLLALVALLACLGLVLVIISDRPDERGAGGDADPDRHLVVDDNGSGKSPTPAREEKTGDGEDKGSGDSDEGVDRDVVLEGVLNAMVVLELTDRSERPLREVRGILVAPDGLVACRFTPLLGAYQARVRLLRTRGARRGVAGLVYRNRAIDLALVQLEPLGREGAGVKAATEKEDPFVPLSEVQPVDLQEERLYVFSHARAREGDLVDSRFVSPSGATGLLVDSTPLADPFVLTDADGALVGLFRETIGGEAGRFDQRSRLLFDSIASVRNSLHLPVGLTLEAMTVRLWEGTFDDWYQRGLDAVRAKRWANGAEFFVKALERRSLDQPSDEHVRTAEEQLRVCYSRQIDNLLRASRWGEAIDVLEVALANFPEEGSFWVALGEARLAASQPAEAVAALLEARKFSAGAKASPLLEEAYLGVAAGALAGNDARAAELTLLEGIDRLPGSAALHMELGSLYMNLEAYSDATRMLERARALDPRLNEVVEGRLDTIRRILSRRDALVIPIQPGSNSIRANVVVDGAREHRFIIDTGATFTAIPSDLAEALGYNLKRADKVRVRTAGGAVMAPVIHARSVDLGGYTVRNLRVLVLPSGVGPREGLLGMNFLKHFRYTVENNEFRLERQ